MASVLVIPGAFFDKGGTSFAITLASAIVGCVVMVIASMPLALIASSAKSVDIRVNSEGKRINAFLISIIALFTAGFVVSTLHAFMLVPIVYFHLFVLAALVVIAVFLLRRYYAVPLPDAVLRWIDVIIISSGLLYGAITGATTFPAALLLGTCSVASGIAARGMISRSPETSIKSEHVKSSWIIALLVSADTAIIASFMTASTVPMIYLALTSVCFILIAMYLQGKLNKDAQSRTILRRMVTFAMFFEVLAIFLGSL